MTAARSASRVHLQILAPLEWSDSYTFAKCRSGLHMNASLHSSCLNPRPRPLLDITVKWTYGMVLLRISQHLQPAAGSTKAGFEGRYWPQPNPEPPHKERSQDCLPLTSHILRHAYTQSPQLQRILAALSRPPLPQLRWYSLSPRSVGMARTSFQVLAGFPPAVPLLLMGWGYFFGA